MSPFPPPQQIVQTREVDALALINGQCDLRAYPFRHLAVVAGSNLSMPRTTGILIAVEILSQWGWELVSVTKPFESVDKLVAFLRRH
ncbi:transcriptional regulator [Plantactinospora sp. S1510]|uniref:Transcriptional regulator n=1 Tax=Plantactinospora alkalitolerans TaxID=2789879 RepID=A0ABS0H4X7_9ACTN|nr:transcriptional regulator [Plantactinospora alkalitolerans]MBF9133513.1 transcriptional regulator [Plantactinospora alkalitolerans]